MPHRSPTSPGSVDTSLTQFEQAVQDVNDAARLLGRSSVTYRFSVSAYDRTSRQYKYLRGGLWVVELQVREPGAGRKIAHQIERQMVQVQRMLTSGL